MAEVRTYNKIAWEVINEIGYLQFIDLPENRMDSQFFEEINELTKFVIPTSYVKGIIVSGKGRHFSSGANLDQLFQTIQKEQTDDGLPALHSNYQALKFLDDINVPVIAAIKGVCLGSALELALHCHFRLCATDAILGLPETSFGLMPGLGGIPKLLASSGKAKAIELVLKGNTFAVSDALKWNIVDAVFSKKELMSKSEQLIELASVDYRKYKKKEYLKSLVKSQARAEVRGSS